MRPRMIYIDGYNALRNIPRFAKLMKSNADAARRAFTEHTRTKVPYGSRVNIVFDGAGEHIGGSGSVQVTYSYTRTADSWIRMAVEKEKRPQSVLVVSSDHEVIDHARACGATVQRVDEFYSTSDPQLETDTEKPGETNMSKDEIDMWMKLFTEKTS